MISEPGGPTGGRDPPEEETTMFKTIAAALLAVSVLAAPALAATPGKTIAGKTAFAPVIKAEHAKSKALNANARMGRHHHHHKYVHHHRHHSHHMAAFKKQVSPKVAIKPAASVARRG
jgi:hypothetical protein